MTGPDEGGGAPAGLQPSGTLLASEEDVVEGGWAPTTVMCSDGGTPVVQHHTP